MTTHQNDREVREVVGVFKTPEALQNAIDDLLSSGFDHSEVSLLAAPEEVDRKLGHRFNNVEELEDEAKAPRTFYIAPESIGNFQGTFISILVYIGAVATAGFAIATGSAMAKTILAVMLGGIAGAVIGVPLAILLWKHHTRYVEDQLKRGGLLVWVRAWNAEQERQAMQILSKNKGKNVHIHATAV